MTDHMKDNIMESFDESVETERTTSTDTVISNASDKKHNPTGNVKEEKTEILQKTEADEISGISKIRHHSEVRSFLHLHLLA